MVPLRGAARRGTRRSRAEHTDGTAPPLRPDAHPVPSGRRFRNDLGDIRELQDDLLDPLHEAETGIPQCRVLDHDEHFVEEAVDGRAYPRGLGESLAETRRPC